MYKLVVILIPYLISIFTMKCSSRFTCSIIFILLLANSCRKEEFVLVETPKEETLIANSAVANLMRRTAINDGSGDNIIDKANCFNIQLPITVMVNSREITIVTEEDFQVIEAIFEEFSTDEDTLVINFPITIILSNFSETLINSSEELTNLAVTCNGENEQDDDIECIDFIYPITASLFNKTTELTNKATIINDMQLYNFIDDLEDNIIITVDFPINVQLSDGTETAIDNLSSLERVIEEAEDDCDEDDDFDFDDDDNINVTNQEFINLLTACDWVVEELEQNGGDKKDEFNGYVLIFNMDGTIDAINNSDNSSGIWEITSDDGLRLNITMDILTNINNNWRLHEIEDKDDGTRLEIRIGEDHAKFRQSCN